MSQTKQASKLEEGKFKHERKCPLTPIKTLMKEKVLTKVEVEFVYHLICLSTAAQTWFTHQDNMR